MKKTKQKDNLDPLEFFNQIKNKKSKWNTAKLKTLRDNTETLLLKAHALGQESVKRKLLFNLEVIQKEKKLFKLEINKFIYRDDIVNFIEDVSEKVVKLIKIKNYPREIPNEISNKIIELKNKKIFDDFVILFTDYTGEVERQVEEERKRKDPIIFGIFQKDRNVCNRFYYLGDWEDEYCDLTLDRMIGKMAEEGIEIEHSVEQNITIEEIRSSINSLDENNKIQLSTTTRKPSFFQKVKLWFKR